MLSHFPPMVYAGRVNCITGYGGAARHQIHTLRSHGLRLRIVDTGSAGDPDPARGNAFVQACRRDNTAARGMGAEMGPRGSIIHVGPNMSGEWRRKLPKPHVLVSVWETNRLPAEWVPIADSFEQVWCATQWQADVYIASGVHPTKVRFVPFALDPALYPAAGPTIPEIQALRDAGYTVFGSMFQWTERKAPRALIGAYLAAFQAGEKTALVLKAYEGDDAGTSCAAHVAGIVGSYQSVPGRAHPRIEIITRRLTHDDTLAFYRSIDCYVSTHRGEGFGLPIAEALLLNRDVIATDWSAPAEYAQGLYLPVGYTMEAPHSMGWQPFYTLDQEWAAPCVADVVRLMGMVHSGQFFHRPTDARHSAVVAQFQSLMRRAGEAAASALADLHR